MDKNFSAIILAAGKSERLGFPKLSLRFDKDFTFIERIANQYKEFGCEEIIVIVNEIGKQYIIKNKLQFPENTKIILNKYPDWHRFYSLKIGVKSLSNMTPVFIHNADNPFVNHQVLNELANNIINADYINPEYEGKGGHPIFISEKIVQYIINESEDQLHFKEFLNQYKKLKVPVEDENVLVNINTLEEYRKYFE